MQTEIKIYKIKDFIRKNELGTLSYERVIEIVKEFSAAASLHPDCNILLDFRKTKLSDFNMVDIMKAASEMDKFKYFLKNRIANVIPKDKDRISIAKKAEAAIQLKGFQYKFFTDFEEAIEWLSDINI